MKTCKITNSSMLNGKIARFTLFLVNIWIIIFSSPCFSQTEINQKLQLLDIKIAELKDVIDLFGEPEKYVSNQKTYKKDNLPDHYVFYYPKGLRFFMRNGKIGEIRHEGPTGYTFKGRLQFGSSLETALEVLGKPTQTITGKANEWANGILYKDIENRKGYCYYQRTEQNIRLFFNNYKVTSLAIVNPQLNKITRSGSGNSKKITIDKLSYYQDVRGKDLKNIKKLNNNLLRSLTYNQGTVWPQKKSGSKTLESIAEKILSSAMNPGLGIGKLHQTGITGKGVNVAIIDQPMYLDHLEFKGKIAAYHDVGCGTKSSMHGPAVASLLVGENCGTAPGAKVYFAASPQWTKDSAFQAKGLEWIIEQNRLLPPDQKIRVVSVSANPSGPTSTYKNKDMWDKAYRKAESEGIMVLDCTDHNGFISGCFFKDRNIEKPTSCRPGFPSNPWVQKIPPEKLFVPTCPRTTAQQYNEGNCTYIYWGQGGLSWAIPYAAGVLAMGWQIWPEATPEQMKKLLLKSAYINNDQAKIIYPPGFIKHVKKARRISKP